MAYRLSAAEKRARSRELLESRESRDLYDKYLRDREEAQKASSQKDEADGLTKTLHTVGDVGANVLTGVGKGLEGIVDFGAGLVGAVGGIFSDDFQDSMQDFIARDHTGELYGNAWQEALEHSALNDSKVGQIVEGVAQGVGQMLPAVAMSVATGGAAAPALFTTMVSAAGTGAEQAFQEGANYGQGMLYGTATGALEGAVEKMTGGFSKLYGGGWLDDVVKAGAKGIGKEAAEEVAEVGIRRVVKDMIGEGAEEVIAELANPLTKTIYKGKDALSEYGEGEYWQGVVDAGIIGAGTSLAYGGTVGHVTKQSGVYADATSVAEHVDEQRKKRANPNLTQAEKVQIEKNIKADNEVLSQQLQKLSDKSRARVMEARPELSAVFEADGTIKAEQLAALDANIEAAADTTYDARYRSSTLGKATIEKVLANGSTSTEKAIAFSGELDAEGQASLSHLQETAGAVAYRSGDTARFLVAENVPEGRSYYDVDNKVAVISVEDLKKGNASSTFVRDIVADTYFGDVIHEVGHGIEGTRSGEMLDRHLKSNESVYNLAIEDMFKRGYMSEFYNDFDTAKADVQRIVSKVSDGNTLTSFEQKVYDTFKSETFAFASQRVLGNEAFAKKLVQIDPSGVEKILAKISELCENLKTKKSPDAKKTAEYLRTAEKLYLNAISEMGGTYKNGKIHLANREEEEQKAQTREEKNDSIKVKYNLNENAAAELHKALYDKNYRSEVLLRDESPAIMVSQKDVRNLPMAMKASHIRENVFTEEEANNLGLRVDEHTHYHGLGEKFFLEIIDGLDNITEAYRGTKFAKKPERRENYFLLVSKLKDANGNTINVPVYINEYAQFNRAFIDVNKIATNFAKEDFYDYIQKQIRKGYLVRIKNRSTLTSERDAAIAPGYEKNASNDIVAENSEKSTAFAKKLLEERIGGDDLLNAQDLISDVKELGGQVDDYGFITLYHRTSAQNAADIRNSGEMLAKEDGLFFSTKKDGQNVGYGDTIVTFSIPAEKLLLDDIFDDEAHLRYPLKKPGRVSMKEYLVGESGKILQSRNVSEDAVELSQDELESLRKDRSADKRPTSSHDAVSSLAKEYKQYSQKEVKGLVKTLLSDVLVFEKGKATFERKADIEQEVKRLLDTVSLGKTPEDAIAKIADYILEKAHIKGVYADASDEIVRHQKTAESFSRYLHSLDLTPVMGDITKQDGRMSGEYYRWGNREGNEIITLEELKAELLEQGYGVKNKTPKQVFFMMDNAYRTADKALKRYEKEHGSLKAVLPQEEYTKAREAIIERITELYSKGGRHSEGMRVIAEREKQLAEREKKISKRDTRITKIVAGMSDARRYEALKNRSISLSAVADIEKLSAAQEKLSISDADMEFSKYGDRVRLFKKLGEEFSAFRSYKNKDIRLDFSFSKEKMRESVSKQRHDYVKFAKMLTCLDDVIANAVGIEVHNRNAEGYKVDDALENMYVLASAFVDGEDIVPVKLEVKEFSDKENTLHLAIALESIKKDGIVKQEVAENGVARQYSPPSDISIAEYFKKINPSDESFRKYIPKQFFETETLYSQDEARAVVDKILSEVLVFSGMRGVLRHGTYTSSIQKAFAMLNSAEDGKRWNAAYEVAAFIMKRASLVDTVDAVEVKPYLDLLEAFKPYVKGVDLSTVKKELFRLTGSDEAFRRWHKPKEKGGISIDEFFDGIRERGYEPDQDAARALTLIDEEYSGVKELLSEKVELSLEEVFLGEEAEKLKREIAKVVFNSFDENKSFSYANLQKVARSFAAKLEHVTAESRRLRREKLFYEQEYEKYYKSFMKERDLNEQMRGLANATRKTVELVKDIRNWKKGNFQSASKHRNSNFEETIGGFARIAINGQLNLSGARKIFQQALSWYTEENEIFSGYFDSDIVEKMKAIAEGKGAYTATEVKQMGDVLQHFKKIVNEYGKIFRRGKRIEARPEVERYQSYIEEDERLNTSFTLHGNKFFREIAEPLSLAMSADKYRADGFFTETIQELRQGLIKKETLEMDFRHTIDEFMTRQGRRYQKSLNKETIEVGGIKIPKNNALLLYMTTKDADAHAALNMGGFTIADGAKKQLHDKDTNKALSADGLILERIMADEEVTLEEATAAVLALRSELYKQFSEADKELIRIAETFFNKDGRKVKHDTDVQVKGYSNVKEGYYVPLSHDGRAEEIGLESAREGVLTYRFNKSRVKGAKGRLVIRPLTDVLFEQMTDIATYAGLSVPIENFNRLYNLSASDNRYKPKTIKTMLAQDKRLWSEGMQYFQKIINGIEGGGESLGIISKAIGFLRGGLVRTWLSVNPKVLATQVSALAASFSKLNPKYVGQRLFVRLGKEGVAEMDKYCRLAELRNQDNSAALAQGVLDDINRFGDIGMKGIGWVDRLMITRLWNACRLQVQDEQGLAFESEENKVAAGKLLETVILDTQQNSLITERSAMMRSSNELWKSFTMFTADAMKVMARFLGGFGRVSTLHRRIKLAKDQHAPADQIARLEQEMETAKREFAGATAALLTSAVYMAAISLLFKALFGKLDDEDEAEDLALDFGTEVVSSILGGLPIIREIWDFIANGYEIDNYSMSAVNDILSGIKGVYSLAGDVMNGRDVDKSEFGKKIKNLLYAVGQIFGVPLRNVHNILYGITKFIDAPTAYRWESAIYSQNYKSDLKKAIQAGDERMIAIIAELMVDESAGSMDAKVRDSLKALLAKGYDVLPRSVGDSVTVDGETLELTGRQRKRFAEVYAVGDEALADMVKLSQFKSADEAVRAKAVRFIYDVYWQLALQDITSGDIAQKNVLFAEAIDIEKLAIIIATARSIEADKDRDGKAISGSKKRKIQAFINSLHLTAAQKYMVMGYLGYSNLNGEAAVKRYIGSLKLTKAEKASLLAYSGYAAS